MTEEIYGKTYESPRVENLTVEELKKSKMSDDFVVSVWSGFKSDKNRNYTAVHVFDRHYILLSQNEKDKKDFSTVRKIVAKETRGSPKKDITERWNDICNTIDLNQRITQAIVTGFIERYQTRFKDVTTPVVYFRNVPEDALEKSGLPSEKLKYGEFTIRGERLR